MREGWTRSPARGDVQDRAPAHHRHRGAEESGTAYAGPSPLSNETHEQTRTPRLTCAARRARAACWTRARRRPGQGVHARDDVHADPTDVVAADFALADDLARGPLQVAEILAAAGRLAQPRLGVPILLTGLSGSHRASTLT